MQGPACQSGGASRFVQIVGNHKGQKVNLQLILDEPPAPLHEAWVKSGLEY